MLEDRPSGEECFEALRKEHPRDGMVRFKRGEACEALGEYSLAQEEYEQAEDYFPMARFKALAREGAERMRQKLLRRTTTTKEEDTVLGAGKVLEVIGGLTTLLDRIEDRTSPKETLNDRIKRLEKTGRIPRDIANHMHYIKNARNKVAHP